MHDDAEELDELAVAEIAAAAQTDRRTVRKALRGDAVRGLAGARIRRAIAEWDAAHESGPTPPKGAA